MFCTFQKLRGAARIRAEQERAFWASARVPDGGAAEGRCQPRGAPAGRPGEDRRADRGGP